MTSEDSTSESVEVKTLKAPNLLAYLWSFPKSDKSRMGYSSTNDLNSFYNSLEPVVCMFDGLDDKKVKKPSFVNEGIETDFDLIIMQKQEMYSKLTDFKKENSLLVKDFLTYTPAEVVQLFALNYTVIKQENEEVEIIFELNKANVCSIDDTFPLTFNKTIEAQLLDLPEDLQYELIQGFLVFDDVSNDNKESSERHFVLPSNHLQIEFEETDTELKQAFKPFNTDPMLYQTDSLDVWLPYTIDFADIGLVKEITYDLYTNKDMLKLSVASSVEEQFTIIYNHILREVYSHTEGLTEFFQYKAEEGTFLQQWEEQLREQRLKIKQIQKKTDKDYEKYEILKYFVDKSFVQEMNRYRKTNSVPYRFLVRFFRSKST